MKYEIKRLKIPEIIGEVWGCEIGFQTMIGICDKNYPIKGGNCFSMDTKEGREYRILNFGVENLNELIRRGLELPVRLHVLREGESRGIAVLNDERIDNQWYNQDLCTVCTPYDILNLTQRLKIWRDEESGYRERRIYEDGTIMISYDFKKIVKVHKHNL